MEEPQNLASGQAATRQESINQMSVTEWVMQGPSCRGQMGLSTGQRPQRGFSSPQGPPTTPAE